MLAPRLSILRFGEANILVGPGVAVFAALMVLSFRYGLFPFWYEGLSAFTYWGMSLATTAGILVSVFLHDMSHLFSERWLGGKPKSIHFYLFGDVPVGDEPTARKIEWKVAFAGPLFSLALGLALFGICLYGDKHGMARPLVGILFHVAAANLTLALFNLLPFFPLDGGRVLRAMLWRSRKNFQQSNTLATRGGLLLSVLLLFSGSALAFDGKLLTGGWFIAFGLALGFAAQVNRESTLLRALLKPRKSGELMNRSPITVSPGLTLDQLAADYFDKYHFKVFPVVDRDKLIGVVTEKDLGKVPPGLWSNYDVAEVTKTSASDNTIAPNDSALKAFDLIKEHGLKLVLVAEKGTFRGIITPDDLWDFVATQYRSPSHCQTPHKSAG